MAEKGLQVFLNQLVKELDGLDSEVLRSEYDFEPHTFIFEPTDLSDIMIKAAAAQTQYGWTPSSGEIKYMKDQAKVYGKRLVEEVLALGGSEYGTDGCVLLIGKDEQRIKVLPSGKQYGMAKNAKVSPESLTVQSAFNKVKQVYSKQLEAYFKDLQATFGEESIEGSKKSRGFRQSATRSVVDKETGKKKKIKTDARATSGSSIFRVTAGHKHNEGILETALARAMNTTADNLSSFLKTQKLDLTKIKKMMKELEIDMSCVRAADGEGFEIRMEFGPENGAFGQDMKKAKADFLEGCKLASNSLIGKGMLATLTGSDSILTRNRKLIIKEVVDQFKRNKKVKSIKHENIKLDIGKGNKATTTVGKAKLKKEKRMSLAGASIAIAAPKAKRRRPKQSTPNLASLLGYINMRLPAIVEGNMGTPRLESRTGRFAQSVRATDISRTAQGFPSIGYTYAKQPYGVYENTSGSRFADSDRDPRPLIDQSIREIVMQLGVGRIYTRRQ